MKLSNQGMEHNKKRIAVICLNPSKNYRFSAK